MEWSERASPSYASTFLALVTTQAAHSTEEYVGRLYEVFPPARFASGLVSQNRELGFVVLNFAIVVFGMWCYAWPVRKRWRGARAVAWLWVGIETLNGIGHPVWSVVSGMYVPGTATALILFVLALRLASRLASERKRVR
jgi:hypothetical protein